ncbi:MAG: L,D-transpeptidase [Actinomycetota bacterium]
MVATATVAAGCATAADPLLAPAPPPPVGPTVELTIAEQPRVTVVATAEVSEVSAYRDPDASSPRLAALANPIPTGSPLVFQVLEQRDEWLRVLLPVRPNGSSGWISLGDVSLASTPYRIEIDTSDHRMVVWEDGQVVVDAVIAIGTGDTPTPLGDFYLTELLQPPDPTGPYGSFAYGLSGFSETLTEFRGGDGVIGLHGTNEPESLGTDVSHGCVRIENEVIESLVPLLPLGTPVEIRA